MNSAALELCLSERAPVCKLLKAHGIGIDGLSQSDKILHFIVIVLLHYIVHDKVLELAGRAQATDEAQVFHQHIEVGAAIYSIGFRACCIAGSYDDVDRLVTDTFPGTGC